ncbi:hypothetical protein MKEN_00467400 [Mycena kentingensis (nom. inval.)]|nr:hypothetical protein MKEN_00467400 [Mycena kentingensis (nom. inval.)]
MTAIPQEILDEFIGHVDSTDFETLESCALTARRFYGASQRGLFRRLTLAGPDGLRVNRLDRRLSFQAAASKIAEFPHLAAYIRELVLGLPQPPDNPEEDRTIYGLAAVVAAVAGSGRLRVLRIEGSRNDWQTLGVPVRTIKHIVAQPNLQEIGLSGVHQVPFEVVIAALGVPVVHLSVGLIPEWDEPYLGQLPTRHELVDLVLSDDSSAADDSLSRISRLIADNPDTYTSKLTDLMVPVDATGMAERIAAQSASTLNDLFLLNVKPNHPLAFTPLPHLTTLEICYDCWLFAFPAALPDTLASICLPGSLPALRELKLTFTLDVSDIDIAADEIDTDWAALTPDPFPFFAKPADRADWPLTQLQFISCTLALDVGEDDDAAEGWTEAYEKFEAAAKGTFVGAEQARMLLCVLMD